MKTKLYDFPVESRALMTEGGIKLKGKRVIVRTDTKNPKPLAVVSDQYKIVPHKEVIRVFENIKGIKQNRINVCRDGAIMFGEYDIIGQKKLSNVDVKVGDTVNFKVRVFNSYDTSTGVGFEIMAVRLVCTNGLLVPSKMARFAFKHFGNADIGKIQEAIVGRLRSASQVAETWKEWLKVKPSDNRVKKFFEANKKIGGEKTRKELMERALGLKERNVWQIYNVVTEHFSHNMKFRSPDNQAQRIRRKEYRALPLFHTYKWNER